MNQVQRLWWVQARSDWDIFKQLFDPHQNLQCHSLHYLQMTCEKLAKAYAAANATPVKRHDVFAPFLRKLTTIPDPSRQLTVANAFGFPNYASFVFEVYQLLPLAKEVDDLSPQAAGPFNPNAEYPWPSNQPTQAPASFQFPIHSKLTHPLPTLSLLEFVERALGDFSRYG